MRSPRSSRELPARLAAVAALVAFEIALRRGQTRAGAGGARGGAGGGQPLGHPGAGGRDRPRGASPRPSCGPARRRGGGETGDAGRGRGGARLGGPDRGWLPADGATRGAGGPALPAARAVRSAPDAGRGLAGRRGSRGADRAGLRRTPSERVASRPAAGRDRQAAPGAAPARRGAGHPRRFHAGAARCGSRCGCWRRPSRAPTRRCWPCSPTGRDGRPRRWPWPSGPASGQSSEPSGRSRSRGRCVRSAAGVRSAGSPRPSPDSRRPCCSPARRASVRKPTMPKIDQPAEIVREYGPFPGVSDGARGQLRRAERVVRRGRDAPILRPCHRRDRTLARRRRRRGHRVRRAPPLADRRRPDPEGRSGDRSGAVDDPRARRGTGFRADLGGRDALGGAAPGEEDPPDRSRDRRHPAHDRVEPLRHRRHLGRRRALARDLGGERVRHPAGRSRRPARCSPGSTMPEGIEVSGLESDQRDLFYAGGGSERPGPRRPTPAKR